jgi:hypothetical protein
MHSIWNLAEVQNLGLSYLEEQYCWWDISHDILITQDKQSSVFESTKMSTDLPLGDGNFYYDTLVKRKSRWKSKLDITDKLNNLLLKISRGEVSDSDFQNKIRTKSRNPNLIRSSKFIGVSRNGDNWQAMINNGGGKQYIGTYSSEKWAAIAYDFHCLTLHQCSRKTNFSYNVSIFEKIASHYFENENTLNASKFVNIVE